MEEYVHHSITSPAMWVRRVWRLAYNPVLVYFSGCDTQGAARDERDPETGGKNQVVHPAAAARQWTVASGTQGRPGNELRGPRLSQFVQFAEHIRET